MKDILNIGTVLLVHEIMINRTGGSLEIRDRGIIESSIMSTFASFDGTDLYHSVLDKISAVTYSIINNHGFVDGNKRTGIDIMILLLKKSNIIIEYTQNELIKLGLDVAGNRMNREHIKEWISSRIK